MKLSRLVAIAAAGCGLALASTNAQAQTDSFRVEANATHTTELTICNPVVEVILDGDGDTDLDFVITNDRGQVVHSDFDYSDDTTAILRRRASSGCEDFTVETTNLGNVWNLMDVTMNTLESQTGNPVSVASYRVEANAVHRVDLTICNPQVRIDIAGDGDTDLDFVITNSRGQVVHSDYGFTDETSTILRRGPSSGCEEFDLETTNLGNVYNLYQVSLEDITQDPPASAPVATGGGGKEEPVRGSNDGNNRAMRILNNTGQTIMFLYWSNVATNSWGDDRLGNGVLADGQDWNVIVDDGSGACVFDFRADLADGRRIERRAVNVCTATLVQFF